MNVSCFPFNDLKGHAHILPEASGRQTSESESFIRKDGGEGIEKKTEARSDRNRWEKIK